MIVKKISIPTPSRKEKKALRMMIFIGVISIIFFLYSVLQRKNIGNIPLYVLLMTTILYYCLKYLHEWYHYFSISVTKVPVSTKKYTVDILTTYCAGEPFDMLEQTLRAIRQINYPHTAWCCDEADDPKVKQLCESLGVRHVTRTDKRNAKAGNINNALQFATGELCVILDPDHVPAPGFLDEIVPYFDDPTIGYVQIVQAYYNQSESIVAKGAAQQTYQFYGPMMMGMNSYGTVQAIGANCTFRREALDSIGGHAAGLAEDMHTSMQMHAKGWRSIYLPSILTRGLVPATMSSYFKQQLKWSRGTWELFLVNYPRLFSKFTWKQKLHYFTLPLHYFGGFIFLINFLIPVVSLFTGYIPLKMDVFDFTLASVPLFAMSIIIRHYVQKWVAEENEQGFHIVGGILQIGTWWIHSLGIVYTFLRKKVPYIPTPKNDNDPLPFLLNLPNFLIVLISLTAIVYGYTHDYNPYTIFMVSLASTQILCMIFIFSISGYINEKSKLNILATKLKSKTWLIVQTHSFIRRHSVSLSCLLIIAFTTCFWKHRELPSFPPNQLPTLDVFYAGVYPQDKQDPANYQSLAAAPTGSKNIAIIAFDVPWGSGEKNKLDEKSIREVYRQRSIPLLNWQAWQQDSLGSAERDTAVMQHILTGRYDEIILSFARQVAELEKPVYISFGTEPIQRKCPLFTRTHCDPEQFISAWRYVHHLFGQAGADKAIWVWNPWDPTSINDYFPGTSYVDWLGVAITAGKASYSSTGINSFDALYRPYHQSPWFRSGLPVMITKTTGEQMNGQGWWNAGWQSIDTAFNEIKSVIIGGHDFSGSSRSAAVRLPLSAILSRAPATSMPADFQEPTKAIVPALPANYELPAGLKAVVYDKGFHWFRNRHTLNYSELEADIIQMKGIGINTVERSMPGVYDDNLGKVLESSNMKLISRLSSLSTAAEINDPVLLERKKSKILKLVKDNMDKAYIVAWNLGDDVLYTLSNQTYKPDYYHYQQKYLSWLSDLCREMRQLDRQRPIVIDLRWDENGAKRFSAYKASVPEIDKYMLVADAKYKAGLNLPLEKEMAWGKIEVALWPLLPSVSQSGTIPAWQDLENTDFVSLNGLLDMQGRKKEWYREVEKLWGHKQVAASPLPDIKILRPAEVTNANTNLLYHIIHRRNSGSWKLYTGDESNCTFEWFLVRTDQYGNTMFIKKAGTGPAISLSIPMDPHYYHLYVQAVMGDDIKTVCTSLNTPLE